MALKTTNKNRNKVSYVEAKVELHNHEQQIESTNQKTKSVTESKKTKKSNHKIFFFGMGIIALIAFFVI